jgi:hypothetical protein
MQEPNGDPKDAVEPVAPDAPAAPTADADESAGAEKEKEKAPEIPIVQVPMDGVCGGY